MHMTYEHLSDLDVGKAVARANGIKVSEQEEEIIGLKSENALNSIGIATNERGRLATRDQNQ